MKFLRLAVSAAVIAFVPMQGSAIAQDADYLCFMTTSSGQVIDLSDSVCQLKKSAPPTAATPSNSDQAFIKDYKRTVSNYPDMRDKLLARVAKSPEQGISEAKNVCDELKAGLSLDEIQQNQAGESFEKTSVFNISVISTLATKYYCPEFKDQ